MLKKNKTLLVAASQVSLSVHRKVLMTCLKWLISGATPKLGQLCSSLRYTLEVPHCMIAPQEYPWNLQQVIQLEIVTKSGNKPSKTNHWQESCCVKPLIIDKKPKWVTHAFTLKCRVKQIQHGKEQSTKTSYLHFKSNHIKPVHRGRTPA